MSNGDATSRLKIALQRNWMRALVAILLLLPLPIYAAAGCDLDGLPDKYWMAIAAAIGFYFGGGTQ